MNNMVKSLITITHSTYRSTSPIHTDTSFTCSQKAIEHRLLIGCRQHCIPHQHESNSCPRCRRWAPDRSESLIDLLGVPHLRDGRTLSSKPVEYQGWHRVQIRLQGPYVVDMDSHCGGLVKRRKAVPVTECVVVFGPSGKGSWQFLDGPT
jgi:hypothetical protein